MGSVEGDKDSGNYENEGGIRESEPNFVDDGKCPSRSYPKSKSRFRIQSLTQIGGKLTEI